MNTKKKGGHLDGYQTNRASTNYKRYRDFFLFFFVYSCGIGIGVVDIEPMYHRSRHEFPHISTIKSQVDLGKVIPHLNTYRLLMHLMQPTFIQVGAGGFQLLIHTNPDGWMCNLFTAFYRWSISCLPTTVSPLQAERSAQTCLSPCVSPLK